MAAVGLEGGMAGAFDLEVKERYLSLSLFW